MSLVDFRATTNAVQSRFPDFHPTALAALHNRDQLARAAQLSSLVFGWYENGDYNKIEHFLGSIDSQTYVSLLQNEKFAIAYVKLQTFRGHFQSAFKFISEANPDVIPRSTLISLWDEAHYEEKQRQIGQKKLTPLIKFRVRMKHVPPPNLCPSGKRDMPAFPEVARRILHSWLEKHFTHPYPSQQEKEILAQSTQLSIQQVSTWFANHRRRLRQKGLLNVTRAPSDRAGQQKRHAPPNQTCDAKIKPILHQLAQPKIEPAHKTMTDFTYAEPTPTFDCINDFSFPDSGMRLESPRTLGPPFFPYSQTQVPSESNQRYAPMYPICSRPNECMPPPLYLPQTPMPESQETKPHDAFVFEQNFSQKIFIPHSVSRPVYPTNTWSEVHSDNMFGQLSMPSKPIQFDWPAIPPYHTKPLNHVSPMGSMLPPNDPYSFLPNNYWKPPSFTPHLRPEPVINLENDMQLNQQIELLNKTNINKVPLPEHIYLQPSADKVDPPDANTSQRPLPTFWVNMEDASPKSTISMVSANSAPTSPAPAQKPNPETQLPLAWLPELAPQNSPFSPGPIATSSPRENRTETGESTAAENLKEENQDRESARAINQLENELPTLSLDTNFDFKAADSLAAQIISDNPIESLVNVSPRSDDQTTQIFIPAAALS